MTLTQQAAPREVAPGSPIIEVIDLSKSYGDQQVIDRLSFTVAPGEIFGILGPNGAGKTTAVEIVQGLRRADSGTVRIAAQDPSTDSGRLRSVIGSQLQSAALPERMRVDEALRLFSRIAGDVVDADRLAADWDLSRLARSPFRALSGGEQQRLFLALAMANAPQVVFLDELTQGLDPTARRATWRLIERVRDEGTTVVLVSHYMDEVEHLCDRVGVLVGGRMDTIATPRALVEASPLHVRFTAKAGLADDLARLPDVMGVDTQAAGSARLSYVVTGRGAAPVRVAADLAGRDLWPEDYRIDRTSLEDVFVDLTSTPSTSLEKGWTR